MRLYTTLLALPSSPARGTYVLRKRKAELGEPSESRYTDTTAYPTPPPVLDDVDDIDSQIDPRLRASADNIALIVGNVDDSQVKI